jgi:ribosomal protein S18 acetylase RimI-like enzyme
MGAFQIRPMTGDDVPAAVAIYQAGGWGGRRDYLDWALANPAMQLLVGELDGAVAGTAMATINGSVGWVGSIFVDASLRSRGFGRALTEAVCDLLDAAGCTTQALIASPYGQPLYAGMGFRIDEYYQILEAEPLARAPSPPAGRALRPMRADDLERVAALDRRATAEDRRHLLASLAHSGWLIESGDQLRGFLVSIHPDSAAVVAPEAEDAACLLDQLRHLTAGRAEAAQAAVPRTNEAGIAALETLGWKRVFETPRMLRGADVPWDPKLIWGVGSFGFG